MKLEVWTFGSEYCLIVSKSWFNCIFFFGISFKTHNKTDHSKVVTVDITGALEL